MVWVWTVIGFAALGAAIALFVQGIRVGWPLAGLILTGVAILLFGWGAQFHVRFLVHLHRRDARKTAKPL